ncbi:phenylalanine--tRNA ligase subunit beta [Burkholderiaceae bacterium DAT-1]|nr:phenylalanine--tRNA ligase subunit beta [Burkholderiaceae bacterium DAT-1]
MKFSESWLRTLVDTALPNDELAELLTMAGLEVEENEPAAPAFTGVVVAQVLEVQKHENAEKLNVCKVDAGQGGEPLQIVCGAPNVKPGIKVPCAIVGAVLPGDFKIKDAKLRGVESRGMLCSARELGVSEESDGLLILDADAPVGQDFRTFYQLDDRLLTLKLTPNRTDCLSLNGIAREVAALTGSAFKPVEINAVAPVIQDSRKVVLEAKDACPRYTGRVVRNVNAAAATPAWMRRRLERSGLRSISALVDITNYVLLELGQPMHAFDHDKLSGDVVVRMARTGESLEVLNGKTVALTEDMLVIADANGPQALAGIMGGQASSVQIGETRDVFLESAFFAPSVIAGKARRLGFGSDSSHRFERGIDFANCVRALERATALVLEICGGEAGPVVEAVAELPARPPVRLRVERVARVLGVTLPKDEIVGILSRLGLAVADQDDLIVTPPSFRFDIEIEEDLIEEIARVFGYDNVPTRAPVSSQAMLARDGRVRPVMAVKQRMVERDYQEVVTYAFVEERWERDFAANVDPIRLINPIASQMSVMRSTLFGGLIDNLAGNLNRKHERVRLFEVARVFSREGETIHQPEMLGALAFGSRHPEQWAGKAERIDFYDVKADLEALLAPAVATFEKVAHPALHPGRAARVLINGEAVGVIGELHPQWVQAYDLPAAPVMFEIQLGALVNRELIKARTVSKFQPVRRDLAFVVDEAIAFADVHATLKTTSGALVTSIDIFDVYRGKGMPEGKKSLAFKVILQDTQRTLTDAEVDFAIAALVAAVQQQFGAQLRS